MSLRDLPSVDEVLGRPASRELLEHHPRPAVLRAVRLAVERVRRSVREAGGPAEVTDEAVAAALAETLRPGLRRVINATGVVLHTNLGRAPLAEAAIEAVAAAASGFSNLELDLDAGRRGTRFAPLAPLLCELTGADAAMAVNNGAAAVSLVLTALARGRGCVVSRGELVEIGGGFRIPDVMRESGARLVEVGTTNRTRLADYEAAIDGETALLVKVHRSNFSVTGFTEEASVAELARLAADRKIPLLFDQGSGCLVDLPPLGLPAEPTVRGAIEAGADLVTFSGDKLLGGPQAGLIVGRRELVARIERHPVARALRVDKLTVAGLEATLRLWRDGRGPDEVPVMRMLREGPAGLGPRAEELRDRLEQAGVAAEVVEIRSSPGGGSLPGVELPSLAVALPGRDPGRLQEALRGGEPAVVARVQDGRLVLDTRTIHDREVEALALAVAGAISRGGGFPVRSRR